MYLIKFTETARQQLKTLEKSSPTLMKKLKKMLIEIAEHPRTGTGKVERLKHYPNDEIYSRRLDKKNRLVYRILKDIIIVEILSVYGHYTDK